MFWRKKKNQTTDLSAGFHETASFAGRRSVSTLATNAPSDDVRRLERVLYCIVLPTKHGGPFKKQADVDAHRQDLVNVITEAGLSCTLFYSIQEDEIYVKIMANDYRLLQEADIMDFTLGLDEDAMRKVATSSADMPQRKPIYLEPPYDPNGQFLYHSMLHAAGEAMHVGSAWQPLKQDDIQQQMMKTLPPFKYLHARYDEGWEKHHLKVNGVQIYRTYSDGSILRTGDRMRLIQIILERGRQVDPDHNTKGAGLNLSKMVLRKEFLAAFPFTPAAAVPLHEKTIDDLYAAWSSWFKLPWTQPLDDVRNVFGEKVALYFAFLGHYTMWLAMASIIGLAVFLHQLGALAPSGLTFLDPTALNSNRTGLIVYTEVPEAAVFALFMALWATFLLEFWKRTQARLALRWGVSNFEQEETERPEFLPSHVLPDPVTGKAENYYSPRSFQFKVIVGLCVIFMAITVVLATIAGIFILKVFVTQPSRTGLSPQDGTYLALVINAIAIQVLGNLYKTIAVGLNEWENYKTDTQYEDSLIFKTFLFSFCNSYATLFYMAYIKSGTIILGELQSCSPQAVSNNTFIYQDLCFGQLGASLLIIFIVQIVVNNSLEVGIPAITSYFVKRANLKLTPPKDGTIRETKMRSPAEDQYYLSQYEGTFDDFLEIALQFGYVTLFVAAFPLAPFLAFCNNVLEIRVDSYKICKQCRRPHYMGAQDIGTWQTIFYIMGLIAVLSNAGVVFFASNIIGVPPGVDIDPFGFKVWMWVVSVAACLAFKWLVDFLVNDVPTEVVIQLARQDYLVRKCLIMEPDDDEDESEETKRESLAAAKTVTYDVLKIDPYVDLCITTLADLIMKDNDFNPEKAFKEADRSKNGKVSKDEFARLLKRVGGIAGKITHIELEMIADALDQNGNGELDYTEFMDFIQKAHKKGDV